MENYLVVNNSGKPLVKLRLVTTNIRLVKARNELGLTQKTFAAAIGTSLAYYGGIESLRINPSLELKLKICAFHGMSIAELFPEILQKAINAKVFDKRITEINEEQVVRLADYREALLIDNRDDIERLLLQEDINKVVNSLSSRERDVIKERFGLEDGRELTLEEIGKEFGVSREMIRQIEKKALMKLRHPSRTRYLKEWHNLY